MFYKEHQQAGVLGILSEDGLYPFNPDAVNYNILNKNRKKTNDSTSNGSQNNKSDYNSEDANLQLLRLFETRILSSTVLEAFKKDEQSQFWSGDVEQKGLFES